MATFFFPQGGRHGCREVQLYFETGSSSFPSPTPPPPPDHHHHHGWCPRAEPSVLKRRVNRSISWISLGTFTPIRAILQARVMVGGIYTPRITAFFLSFSSTVPLLAVQIIRASVALATLIGQNPYAISFIYPKHFLPHNDTNKAKQRQVQIYIIRPCLHSTTLYCWSGTKTLPDRTSVTHENGDFGPVSVTERSCAAPILKVDRHRLVYVPLFSALTPRFNLIKLLQV